MAHFYACADGRARTSAGRIGSIKTGVRASVASWKAGITTHASHIEATNTDLFTARFDGGSGGNASAGSVDYKRDGEEYVVEPDAEFLSKITDDAWARAIRSNPELVAKLKRLVFLQMDKLP